MFTVPVLLSSVLSVWLRSVLLLCLPLRLLFLGLCLGDLAWAWPRCTSSELVSDL